MTTENINPNEELTDPEELGEKPSEKPDQEDIKVVETTEPPYLQKDMPKDISELDVTKWYLMHLYNETELLDTVDDDKGRGMIRIASEELERDGFRKSQLPKPHTKDMQALMDPASNVKGGKTSKLPAPRKEKELKIFAKGAPAEAIVETLGPPDVPGADQFFKGMNYGMKLIIMGVRIGQDLAGSGIAMAKPLIELTKEVRANEHAAVQEAVETATQEAATNAATQVMNEVSPYLGKLNELLENTDLLEKKIKPDVEVNEMKGMMMEIMKPMIKQITSKLTKSLTGIDSGTDSNAIPEGWTEEK